MRHQNGYYIFRAESAGVLPYEKVKDEIYKELKDVGFNEWKEKTKAQSSVQFENEAFFRASSQQPQRSQTANKELFRFRGLARRRFSTDAATACETRIHVSFRPHLTAYRGKLLSKSPKGDAVYAGSFLRKRKIVLDEQMLRTPRVLERIFVHEVFHFVWSKLGSSLPGILTSGSSWMRSRTAFWANWVGQRSR